MGQNADADIVNNLLISWIPKYVAYIFEVFIFFRNPKSQPQQTDLSDRGEGKRLVQITLKPLVKIRGNACRSETRRQTQIPKYSILLSVWHRYTLLNVYPISFISDEKCQIATQ